MPDWSLKHIWHIYIFIIHCYCADSAMSHSGYMVRKCKNKLALWQFRISNIFPIVFIYIWLLRPMVCTITDQTNLLPAPTVMFWLNHFSFRSAFPIHKLNCSTICNCLFLHAIQVGRIMDEYSREKRKKT